MRALPAFDLTIDRFAAWNAAVGLLAAAAATALGAWAVSWREVLTPALVGAFLAGVPVLAGLAGGAMRRRAFRLAFDGRAWRVDSEGVDTVRVALDFGNFLLLRAPGGWLPVQCGGSAADWHALRCALYSPRPAPVRDGTTDASAA